ncbi:GNAT family N-acetyltransferase [Paenibacillus gorillae]|uniref:GNAT family N-acetyltransferase n=1 Tax=Paenibacillus gorillae TaxID=1243662 RepID=UPI0005A938A7|nr:GNAT family N-acetyltransferase [Paenibacillus gorillae]
MITSYGVKLKRLQHNDIEMVRNWRNDPKVSMYMEYREYISQEMQEKWYSNLNENENFYFIIEFEGQDIGLTEIKKISFDNNCGETGMFIADEKYLNSTIPYQVVFALVDFAFYELKLSYLNAYILTDNRRAIRFNKSLGFVLESQQEDSYKQLYKLYKSNYEEKCAGFKKIIMQSL